MSQHDMDVANGPGATFRADMNNALQALASNSVGPLSPPTTFPCQWWGDTTGNRLRRRNSANSAWIDMGPLDALSYLLISGGTLTGPINDATPQTIASATTTDIGVATSNVVYISGTTPITGLGTIAAGARRTVRFLASLTLTYNVTSLILPTAANITTAVNDTAEFVSLGSGNWLCLRYTPANGKSPAFAYDRSNVVGSVFDTAGLPGGALMEYVSNSGGQAWKYANGQMIARTVMTAGGGTSVAGSVFKSLVLSQAAGFPVNFVGETPIIVPCGFSQSSGGGWGSLQTLQSLSSWGTWAVFTHVSVSGTVEMDLMAFGRWK